MRVLVPVHYFHELLANHTIVLAGEVHALFDFGAVDFNERLPRHFVGLFGEVFPSKGAIELPLQCLLQRYDTDEWVFGSGIAYRAPQLFFY